MQKIVLSINILKQILRLKKVGIGTKVVDGDSVYVKDICNIRLSQVDTPEYDYNGCTVSTYFTKNYF